MVRSDKSNPWDTLRVIDFGFARSFDIGKSCAYDQPSAASPHLEPVLEVLLVQHLACQITTTLGECYCISNMLLQHPTLLPDVLAMQRWVSVCAYSSSQSFTLRTS